MKKRFSLKLVENEADINLFWQWRDTYMLEDILVNESSTNVTEEANNHPNEKDIHIREEILINAKYNPNGNNDYKWFFSKEYKNVIMEAFYRDDARLCIVFMQEENKNIGFAVYVIYHSEEGKCLIVDFCIKKELRNKGLGKIFFKLLLEYVKENGAQYLALNVSNENNKKFWKNNGFIEAGKDEYGDDVYEYRH